MHSFTLVAVLVFFFPFRSTAVASDCNTAVNGNAGCGVQANKANSYGPAFNTNGGGWCVSLPLSVFDFAFSY